mmetsp:Transcript_25377/g.50871  ORF Transcript_25377/g.50871 Transcript_25377/m.50871 type:complete len:220 (+) Transcript_25377:3650-4309(+)
MTIQLNPRDNIPSFQQKGTFLIRSRFHFHTDTFDFGVEFILWLKGIHGNFDNVTIVPAIIGNHHPPWSLTKIQHTLQLKRCILPLPLRITLLGKSLLGHIGTVLLIPRLMRNLNMIRTNFGKYLQHLRHVHLSQVHIRKNIACIRKLLKYGTILLPIPIGMETYRLFTIMLSYQLRCQFRLFLQHLLTMPQYLQPRILRNILQSTFQLLRNCLLIQFIQ